MVNLKRTNWILMVGIACMGCMLAVTVLFAESSHAKQQDDAVQEAVEAKSSWGCLMP